MVGKGKPTICGVERTSPSAQLGEAGFSSSSGSVPPIYTRLPRPVLPPLSLLPPLSSAAGCWGSAPSDGSLLLKREWPENRIGSFRFGSFLWSRRLLHLLLCIRMGWSVCRVLPSGSSGAELRLGGLKSCCLLCGIWSFGVKARGHSCHVLLSFTLLFPPPLFGVPMSNLSIRFTDMFGLHGSCLAPFICPSFFVTPSCSVCLCFVAEDFFRLRVNYYFLVYRSTSPPASAYQSFT
jgi:hypothetical protein